MSAPQGPKSWMEAFERMDARITSITPISGANITVDDSVTGKGLVINASPPGGGGGANAANATFPWQPFPSPWKGTGTDPHASDRVLRFKLARGNYALRTPENMMDEFLAFGDATDTEIEEADAVFTQAYLQVPPTESVLGSGGVEYGRGTLKIVEGEDLKTALGTVPAFGADDGAVPSYLVVPLAVVSWWGGKLHFAPGYRSNLSGALNLSGVLTDGVTFGRAFIVSGASA